MKVSLVLLIALALKAATPTPLTTSAESGDKEVGKVEAPRKGRQDDYSEEFYSPPRFHHHPYHKPARPLHSHHHHAHAPGHGSDGYSSYLPVRRHPGQNKGWGRPHYNHYQPHHYHPHHHHHHHGNYHSQHYHHGHHHNHGHHGWRQHSPGGGGGHLHYAKGHPYSYAPPAKYSSWGGGGHHHHGPQRRFQPWGMGFA